MTGFTGRSEKAVDRPSLYVDVHIAQNIFRTPRLFAWLKERFQIVEAGGLRLVGVGETSDLYAEPAFGALIAGWLHGVDVKFVLVVVRAELVAVRRVDGTDLTNLTNLVASA